ncbi:CRISPR-associated endonuclease Cas1 [Tepidiphilus sp. HLB4]
MTTLYLDRSGTLLEASGEVLGLRDAAGRLERRIPIKFLERVIIRARCHLDSSTLACLSAHEVPVLILDGRAGRRLSHWVGAPHNDARRRWGQLLTLATPSSAATLARAFVHAKIRRQRRTLISIGAARPDLRKPLWDACQTLQAIEQRLRNDPALGCVPSFL